MSLKIKQRAALVLTTAILAPIVGLLALPAKVLGGLKSSKPRTELTPEGYSLARNCLSCTDCLAVDRHRDQKS